jgi:exosortase/archaeosortase family protein
LNRPTRPDHDNRRRAFLYGAAAWNDQTVMGPEHKLAAVMKSRRATILLALITTFAGVGLLVDRPKGTVLEWLALPLVVFGGALFALVLWPSSSALKEPPVSLASRFLRRLTLDGRLARLFPALGVSLILADVAYNWILSATPAFQTEDTIVLLAAASLLGYGFVPTRFARERDFVLLFFLWLNAILVFPLLLARLYYADFESSVDVYSWVALAPETSAVLNAVGVSNQVHAVGASTAPGLTFTPQRIATPVTVVITTACSGIYSFGIFASAFIAFVLTEYQTLSRRIWVLLGLGLIASYSANVLRMVVIVLIGYYTDTDGTALQNMLIAHSYAGWLIFLGWIALFWGFLLKAMPRTPLGTSPKIRPSRLYSKCAICALALTPVVPALRCVCGAYYHVACLAAGKCPSCGLVPRSYLLIRGASGRTPSDEH